MTSARYAPPATPARDLPPDLVLPLATGVEWWYWLGGRPCVDLVNTLRERWNRRVETLCSPGDLGAWLRAAGLLGPGAPAPDDGHLRRTRALREAVDACLTAAAGDRPSPPDAVTAIDAALAAAPRATLDRDPTGTPVFRQSADTPDGALAALALDAARLIGTAERRRIRVCAAPDCSARFVDRSPAGRRRWCSMGGCGNRSKVRRHRAAHRAAPSEEDR